MRVCVVAGEFDLPSAPGGPEWGAGDGAGKRAALRALEFTRQGHQVHVLTYDPSWHAGLPGAAQGADLGVRVHPFAWNDRHALLPLWASAAQKHAWALYRALADLEREHPFDAIEFSATAGEAYYALAARRTLGAFPGATITIHPSLTFTRWREREGREWVTRPAAIERHMEHACVEWANPRPTLPSADRDDRVTVIVPVFNSTQWLDQTLASIDAQDHPSIEIIIVDDGSTDADARQHLDQLARATRTRPLRLIRQTNTGLGGARNAGIRAAEAPWVVPLDSDDLLHPTFISTCLAAARRQDPESKTAFVSTLLESFTTDPAMPVGGWAPIGPDPVLLPVYNCASCCSALIRRDAVLDVGGYDTTMPAFEDWELWCALAARGWSGVIIPEFLLSIRVRPDSMLRTLRRRTAERLRAHVNARHPTLSTNPGYTLRLLQGEMFDPEHGADDLVFPS